VIRSGGLEEGAVVLHFRPSLDDVAGDLESPALHQRHCQEQPHGGTVDARVLLLLLFWGGGRARDEMKDSTELSLGAICL
jgi:hypothetical protein